MRRKLLLIGIFIVAAALFFNSDFIATSPVGYDLAYQEDHRNVMAGYEKVHSFADTLPWWTGFIDESHPSLRPLSSYLFYGQNWLGIHYGYGWAWLSAFALFALNCLLVAVLVYCLTRSVAAALASGVLAARAAAWLPTLTTGDGGISFTWFYLSDNTLLIAFMLPSLIAFLSWRATGQRRSLVVSWLMFVLACLTKEQGYILPLMASALCFAPLPTITTTTSRAAIQACLMAALSCAFFVIRAIVLVAPHDPPERGAALMAVIRDGIHRIAPATPYEIVMVLNATDAIRLLACYGAIGYGAFLLWKFRRHVRQELCESRGGDLLTCAALLWLCAMISYIPALGFDVAGHRGLLAVFLKVAAGSVALQGVCPLLLKYGHAIRIARPQFKLPAPQPGN